MRRTKTITSETEFQEWLLSVLEAERERLRKEATAGESRKCTSFEVIKKKVSMETHHEDER